MRYESVSQMFQRYHTDKKNGVKHTPLHTLQECCEEAGIDPRLFGRYAAQHPNAPQPVLNSSKNVGRGAVKYYRKHEFVQWVNQVREQKEKAMPDIKTALQQALEKTRQQTIAMTAMDWAADDEAHRKLEPVQTTPPKENLMTVTVSATTPTPAAPATTNLSRTTFEYVRDNPGVKMDAVMAALEGRGFKGSSVSSLIYQMIKVRLIVADPNGKLTAVVSEYVPIQTSMIRKRKAKAKDKAKAKPVVAAGLASIAPVVTVDAPIQRKHIEIVSTRTGETINPRPTPVAAAPQMSMTLDAETLLNNLSIVQARALYDELRKIFGG